MKASRARDDNHRAAVDSPPGNPSELPMIEASCICGSVRFAVEAAPDDVGDCNCSLCRRYGALWAYDHEGEGIHVSGPTTGYVRGEALGFHFCPGCGCVVYWRALAPNAEGRRRIAVNLRLAEPEAVARIPIEHFDGLVTFEDLGKDGRCVADYWF